MNELAKKIGEVAVGAIIDAIRAGKDRQAALDAAAEAVRRSDIVSDELWSDLDAYIDKVRDFEEDGSG